MSFIRVLLITLLFYLILRTAKNIINSLIPNKEDEKKRNNFDPYKSKYNIRKEDVIEAEYEEINNKENDNSKNKS